jgi:hypothetical protein
MGQLNGPTPIASVISGTALGGRSISGSNRTNTATPSTDPELNISVTATGTYLYRTDINVVPGGASAAASGFRLQLNYSGTITSQQSIQTMIHDQTNPANYAEGAGANTWNPSVFSAGLATMSQYGSLIVLSGWIIFGTSGTASVAYSQYSANASYSVGISAGSTWTLIKIA